MANNDDKNHRPLKKVSKKEAPELTPDQLKELSFFERTMSEMGVTPELNTIKTIMLRDDLNPKNNKFQEEKYFEEDEELYNIYLKNPMDL